MTSVTRGPKNDDLSPLALKAQQDPAALGRLLDKLEPRVRSMVFSELEGTGRGISPADCDDVVQEVLIVVWTRDLARFDPAKGTFAAFLRRRVRWAVGDAMRQRGRDRSCSLDAKMVADEAFEPEAVGQDPESLAEDARRELTLLVLPEVVTAHLKGCQDKSARAAVRGYDLQRKPLREVASKLGVHASNASRARRRGLRYLARSLPDAVRAAA